MLVSCLASYSAIAISHTLQFTTVHYNTCRVFSLRPHCRLSTGILILLNSVISYIARERGCFSCCVTWFLQCRASASQLLLHPCITSHSTVAWSPSNGCKQTILPTACTSHYIYFRLFSLFLKYRVGVWDHITVCVCVCALAGARVSVYLFYHF
jgi:hypothetical protein